MASGLTANPRDARSPTLRELAGTLCGRWRVLIGSWALVLFAILACSLFSPRYEAHFKVLLRRGRSDPMVSPQPASVVDFTRPDVTEEELNSEVELLRDEDSLKQVVRIAGLVPAAVQSTENNTKIESATRKLSSRLHVEALRKSNLIQVSYRDTDPERAARVLTTLSTLYVQKHTALHRPSGEIDFFEQQTEESGRRLRQSEAELVRFTRLRGVVSADLERDIALHRLGEAEAAYRQMDQDVAETDKKIYALREQIAAFPARSVTLKRWADNPMLLEKVKSRLLELQLKRTELLTRFEPTYRLVQEVDRQIEETRAAIAAESLAPVRDETTDKDPNYEWARMELEKAEVQAKSLRGRQADAAAQLASLRTLAQQRQSDAVDQHDLMRAAKADEDNFLLYLRKREEARIGDALDERRILNVAIVEPPAVPVLAVHSILFYFLLSFGAAVSFSLIAAFTAEYFDPTIRNPEQARNLLEVPVLAWFPEKTAETAARESSRPGRPWVVIQ